MEYSHTQQKQKRLRTKKPKSPEQLFTPIWRFCTKDRALWRRFIVGKYDLINQWTTQEVMGRF